MAWRMCRPGEGGGDERFGRAAQDTRGATVVDLSGNGLPAPPAGWPALRIAVTHRDPLERPVGAGGPRPVRRMEGRRVLAAQLLAMAPAKGGSGEQWGASRTRRNARKIRGDGHRPTGWQDVEPMLDGCIVWHQYHQKINSREETHVRRRGGDTAPYALSASSSIIKSSKWTA
jgi:hypothetical protein